MWLSELLDSISLNSSNSTTQNAVQSDSSDLQTKEVFCHVCDLQFGSSEEDPICPMCNSGFVQQVSDLVNENDVPSEEEETSTSTTFEDDIPEEVLAFLCEDFETTDSIEGSPHSEQCPICMEDCVLQAGNVQRLSCNHVFHQDCINTWLRTTRKCPVCRRRI